MKVTKWSTFPGDLTVSEQKPEQTRGEPGSLSLGPAVSPSSDARNEPLAASAEAVQEAVQAVPQPAHGSANAESPGLALEQDAAAEQPEAEAPKTDAPKTHAAKISAPNADAAASNSHAGEADVPSTPGKVIIMSSGDRAWADQGTSSKPEVGESQGMFGKRRFAALAAVVAVAIVAGAVGGALATAALIHVAGDDAATGSHHVVDASARTDADIVALKAGLEHTSKLGMSQFNKTSERLDRLEKVQAEPAAKLARLSEAIEKLRAAPAAAPMPVAAVPVPVAAAPAAVKEVTGSVSPPPGAAAAATAAKPEVGKLPTVEGWVLRDVARGGALIDGRQGVYEVYAGDFVPGLGRIDAVRRQDGRWVVVTSKGLVVAH
jgi:hypothetical protein